MRTLIESYRNFPGEHCGSVAMRGLLNHYCGLELPEPAVFGLGSGLASVYLSGAGFDPARLVVGRSMGMEVDLAANLLVDYREQPEEDDDLAWQKARDEVLAGRPTMLSGDILYLDYREYKVHFPGHRFVLLGFDDDVEKAFIADRINVAPERCSYGALRTSRNPPEGLSTHNLWGKFHGVEVGRNLADAARIALERCAASMLGKDGTTASTFLGEERTATIGIAAVRRLAEELPTWGEREDAAWLASYNSRCIEKFGNGGGNFRRLYAGFLDWAHALDARLVSAGAALRMIEAADEWTALSETLGRASHDAGRRALWEEAAARARRIADLEESLFRSL